MLGMPAVIVMPQDAPAAKLAATRGYGAEVVLYDRFTEDREALTKRLAAERGMTLIPPYDHPDVIAGQGTAAKELLEEAGALDRLYICLGGGGLTSGSALAARALAPQVQGLRRRARSRRRRPAVAAQRQHRAHRHPQNHRRRRTDPVPG
jgi:threonine dehydratase